MTFPPDIGAQLMQRRPDLVERLSPREREVVAHVLSARSVPQIARLFVRSPETIKEHLKHIYAKLKVSGSTGREQLILLFAVMPTDQPAPQEQPTTEAA
jgi:DNA-binding CsgD family transcriptional regulator